MIVLVLTNLEHESFVYDVASEHDDQHLILVINNEGDADRFWKSFSYDIGISFMYQHKVPAKEVNSHSWFNFHPAPLPSYKGRNLCYHAIMNGETEFGATVHYMDENFDTGDIITKDGFPIKPWYTAEDVSKRAIWVSKIQFKTLFPKILENTVFPRTPNIGGTYYKKTEIEDTIPLHDVPLSRWIRAVTYKDFYPKVTIGGVTYKIVREE